MFKKKLNIITILAISGFLFDFSCLAVKDEEGLPYIPSQHLHRELDAARLSNIKEPFYLIRHGKTRFNELHLIQGLMDIPLNETGEAQAHQAGDVLKPCGIKQIYSSSLSRAKVTAEIIRQTTGLKEPVKIERDLVERGRGEYEGKPDKFRFPEGYDTKEIETSKDAHKRYINVILDIAEKNEECILIVTHNGLVREFLNFIGEPTKSVGNAVPYRISPPTGENPLWKIEKLGG
jgi:uncharacterized phosphatase